MKRKEKLKLLEKEGSIQNQSRNIEESNNKNTSNDGFQGWVISDKIWNVTYDQYTLIASKIPKIIKFDTQKNYIIN